MYPLQVYLHPNAYLHQVFRLIDNKFSIGSMMIVLKFPMVLIMAQSTFYSNQAHDIVYHFFQVSRFLLYMFLFR